MTEAAGQHPADTLPGRALAAARAAQNLTVADVARQLRLTPAQVEALESGDYDRLPGPVFVRGFLRNYARLLKMDPERLLQSAGQDLPAPAAQEVAPPSQDIPFSAAGPRRWPWYVAATAAIIAGLAYYEFYWSDGRDAVITTVTTPGSSGSVETTAVQPSSAIAVQEPPAAVSPVDGEQAQQLQQPEPVLQDGAAAASAAVSAPPPAEDRSAGGGRIRLAFERESWVQIRDRDGRTIFLQHNQPGTEQEVEGLPPFTLVIGNAHGVRLTYNGRPVDLSRHARDDVARLTLE